MKKLTVTTNVRFHWVKYDYHGGQKTAYWFGLSSKEGKYYSHYYQKLPFLPYCGTMRQEITPEQFKEFFETWIKKDEYNLEIREINE